LAAIVYTDIATDGTLEGPNLEQTREVCVATHVPVVASGGVGSLEHLAALRELPLQGSIIGRSLYENSFTIADALAVYEHGRSATA
jgi:phosphoribosylformimino-5-aminoimidazole carboxamide ribotide isomerase